MTEAEWQVAIDPTPMLKFLRVKASERKLRLFACACCRRHRSVLKGTKNRQVLQCSEEFADGRIALKEMQAARVKWYTFDYPFPLSGTWQLALSYAASAGIIASMVANETA